MENLQQMRRTNFTNTQLRISSDKQNAMEGVMESEAASMTVKVSLERGSGDNEIRRFLVAGDANYNKLKNKIGKIFPNCPERFNMTWIGELPLDKIVIDNSIESDII